MENSSFPHFRAGEGHEADGFPAVRTVRVARFSGLDWGADRGYLGGLYS